MVIFHSYVSLPEGKASGVWNWMVPRVTQVPSVGELLRLFDQCQSIRRFNEDRLMWIDQNPNDSLHAWVRGGFSPW